MQDVVLDVSTATIEVEPPEGIEIVVASPELERGAYAVALEADADIPSGTPLITGDFETWQARHFGPLTSRELSLVALEDGVVVAFGVVSRFTDDTCQHSMTGVARRARGRGIAKALKHAQIVAARAGRRALPPYPERPRQRRDAPGQRAVRVRAPVRVGSSLRPAPAGLIRSARF